MGRKRTLRGQIIFHSDGKVTTVKGKSIEGKKIINGKTYSLVGATSSKYESQKSADGYKRQFGTGFVTELEPGNYGVYSACEKQLKR